jgi:hypothetical protein
MAGTVLNSGLMLGSAPSDVRAAFTGGAEPRLLPQGWRVYKYTQHSLVSSSGRVTPWWSSIEPIDAGDPGLAGSLERAARLGVDPARYGRARAAVTEEWNSMDKLLTASLLVPVYGLVGRCAFQRVSDNGPSNVVFIGGAWQLWIPNLTRAEIGEG